MDDEKRRQFLTDVDQMERLAKYVTDVASREAMEFQLNESKRLLSLAGNDWFLRIRLEQIIVLWQKALTRPPK